MTSEQRRFLRRLSQDEVAAVAGGFAGATKFACARKGWARLHYNIAMRQHAWFITEEGRAALARPASAETGGG